MITGGRDGFLHWFDITEKRKLGEIKMPGYTYSCLIIDQKVVIGGACYAHVYSLSDFQLLGAASMKSNIYKLQKLSDTKVLCGQYDGQLQILDINTFAAT
jgi:hypothetical protein